MKTLFIALLTVGMFFVASGCATPAHSAGVPTIEFPSERMSGENANNMVRAWYLDSRMLADDINSVLLLDSPSLLTKWDIR